MIIAYSMSRALYRCFLPTLRSLLEHNSPEHIYILTQDDELPYALPDICEVINISERLESFLSPISPNNNNYFTSMAAIRVCYADILRHEDKIISLDIDTIICDSLEPLWNIDLTGKWFAACPEYLSSHRPFGDTYYNAGVMVFNLAQIRKDKLVPVLTKELNTTYHRYLDQDVLNAYGLLYDKAVSIPMRYNESFCCGYTPNPAVVHYAGYGNWFTDPAVPRSSYLERYL